jgi:hypothetical protein
MMVGQIGQIVQGERLTGTELGAGALQQGDRPVEPPALRLERPLLQRQDGFQTGPVAIEERLDPLQGQAQIAQRHHLMQPCRFGRAIGPPSGLGPHRPHQPFPLIDAQGLGRHAQALRHLARTKPMLRSAARAGILSLSTWSCVRLVPGADASVSICDRQLRANRRALFSPIDLLLNFKFISNVAGTISWATDDETLDRIWDPGGGRPAFIYLCLFFGHLDDICARSLR